MCPCSHFRCVVGLVLAAVVMSACTSPAHRVNGHPTRKLTPFEQVEKRIGPGGGVSLHTAEQLFSLEVQPLPGVRVPAGKKTVVPDASAVVGWLRQYRNQLMPAQRAVLDRVSPPTARSLHRGGATVKPRTGKTMVPSWVNDDVEHIRAWIGQRLGRTLPGFVQLGAEDHPTDYDGGEVPITHFESLGQVHYDGCDVALGRTWFTSTRAYQLDVLAHEVFHCFEDSLSGDVDGYFRPGWVQEGQAEWVGDQYAAAQGFSLAGDDGWWDAYLSGTTPLFRESYAAVGFYSMLADRGIDVWSILDPMYRALSDTAPCKGQCSVIGDLAPTLAASNAALTATGAFGGGDGKGADATDDLVSSTVLDDEWGRAWNIIGPAVPKIFTAHHLTSQELPVGGSVSVPTQSPAGTKAYDVTVSAPVVTITPGRFRGEVRLPDGTSRKLSDIDGSYSFCTGAQCPQDCPGVDTLDVHAGSSLQLAATTVADFTTGPLSASVTESGFQVLAGSDGCPKPSKPVTPSQPATPSPTTPEPPSTVMDLLCPHGCSTLYGDPHLVTFDGEGYDFQGAGEFVAATDDQSGFEVQVRLQPWHQSKRVSVTTAAALDLAGTRVEARWPGGRTITTLIDGAPWTGDDRRVGHGGHLLLAQAGGDVRLTASWPDGTQVTVSPSSVGETVVVSPSAALGPRLHGLLGSADHDTGDDIAPRGASPLARPVSAATLFPAFADSWRVSDASSLFTYDDGQDTATFTDRTFPHSTDDAGGETSTSDAQAAAARQTCTSRGVVDEPYLQNCIADLLATGEQGSVTTAHFAQSVGDQQAAATTVPDVTGRPQAAAEDALHQSQLRTTLVRVPGSASAAGTALCTKPAAGTTVPAQTAVRLYVLAPGAATTSPC